LDERQELRRPLISLPLSRDSSSLPAALETRNEETMIERGHEDLVRTYRLRFQEAMEDPTVEAVQRITGRKVLGYHSQIVFSPERAFEIFVLDRPVDSSG
jgi:uncharacterized protein YbcI